MKIANTREEGKRNGKSNERDVNSPDQRQEGCGGLTKAEAEEGQTSA